MTIPAGTITDTIIKNELGISGPLDLNADTRGLAQVPAGTITYPTHLTGKKGLRNIVGGSGAFNETNTATIGITGNAAIGDIAIMFDMALNSDGTFPSFVTPPGWTGLSAAQGTGEGGLGLRARCSYRVLTAGQPGSTITGMNGTERNRKIITVVRPALPIASVTPVGWSALVGAGALGPINIGAGNAPNCIFVAFACAQSAFTLNATTSGSWTDIVSDTDGAIRGMMWCATRNDTPASKNISMTDGGDSNALTAGILNLTF